MTLYLDFKNCSTAKALFEILDISIHIKYEKWDLTHLAIMPTKLTPSQYYFEIIRGYFRTTASISSLRYIRKKCGVRVEIKCYRGAMKMLWHYIKMIWEYRKVKRYEKAS